MGLASMRGMCLSLYGTGENFFWAHFGLRKFSRNIFKPGARPQPAEGRLWACAWFTVIVSVKVCVCTYLSIYLCTYLPMFVRTHPREQNRLITVKAAFT